MNPPLGKRLLWARKLRGIRQNAAARLLGVHPAQLCRWEKGERGVPVRHVEAAEAFIAERGER